MQGILRHFSGTQINEQSKKVELCVISQVALGNNHAYLLRTEINKSHLNNCICQHCGVKTSMVTPSFYNVFNISLSRNNIIPSFIGNLWRVLLLGNYPFKESVLYQEKYSCINMHKVCYIYTCKFVLVLAIQNHPAQHVNT